MSERGLNKTELLRSAVPRVLLVAVLLATVASATVDALRSPVSPQAPRIGDLVAQSSETITLAKFVPEPAS